MYECAGGGSGGDVVTGSRIARSSDFNSPSPVITVDRDSIERSGYDKLQQLMEKYRPMAMGIFRRRATTRIRPSGSRLDSKVQD